jgi:hypothetical protein
MDKLSIYRKYIQDILTTYTSWGNPKDGLETQLIFDCDRDHYQWLDIGWEGAVRVYSCVMHFDIRDGKIWLQRNMTDLDPAEELVELGVPKEDIILGLQPPYKRKYTDYGVA